LEDYQADLKKFEDIVKTQNLSQEEVHQMTTEHETLSRNLEDLRKKVSETNKTLMSLEVNVANRAAATEEALDTYNSLLSALDLLPPLRDPYADIDLSLELNTATSNPHNILVGADIRKVIKPTLSGIAERHRSKRASVESDRIKVDNELDQLTQDCENLEEEIGETERKGALLNDQADGLRDVTNLVFLCGLRLISSYRLLSRKH
jgi:kinetochore protein NDC80